MGNNDGLILGFGGIVALYFLGKDALNKGAELLPKLPSLPSLPNVFNLTMSNAEMADKSLKAVREEANKPDGSFSITNDSIGQDVKINDTIINTSGQEIGIRPTGYTVAEYVADQKKKKKSSSSNKSKAIQFEKSKIVKANDNYKIENFASKSTLARVTSTKSLKPVNTTLSSIISRI